MYVELPLKITAIAKSCCHNHLYKRYKRLLSYKITSTVSKNILFHYTLEVTMQISLKTQCVLIRFMSSIILSNSPFSDFSVFIQHEALYNIGMNHNEGKSSNNKVIL